MNETQKNKIDRFLKDTVMSQAVKSVLTQSFLKAKPTNDTTYLAACFIAVGLLEEGWRELSRYESGEDAKPPTLKQVGL